MDGDSFSGAGQSPRARGSREFLGDGRYRDPPWEGPWFEGEAQLLPRQSHWSEGYPWESSWCGGRGTGSGEAPSLRGRLSFCPGRGTGPRGTPAGPPGVAGEARVLPRGRPLSNEGGLASPLLPADGDSGYQQMPQERRSRDEKGLRKEEAGQGSGQRPISPTSPSPICLRPLYQACE